MFPGDYSEWSSRQGASRCVPPDRWFDWPRFCCRMICPSFVPRARDMPHQFDRSTEDLGNAIHFEHVNVQVPDQRLATLFYVAGLGLTRDPFLMVSDTNMWVNAGRSQ